MPPALAPDDYLLVIFLVGNVCQFLGIVSNFLRQFHPFLKGDTQVRAGDLRSEGYVGESEGDLSGVMTKVGDGFLMGYANPTCLTFKIFQNPHCLQGD